MKAWLAALIVLVVLILAGGLYVHNIERTRLADVTAELTATLDAVNAEIKRLEEIEIQERKCRALKACAVVGPAVCTVQPSDMEVLDYCEMKLISGVHNE